MLRLGGTITFANLKNSHRTLQSSCIKPLLNFNLIGAQGSTQINKKQEFQQSPL